MRDAGSGGQRDVNAAVARSGVDNDDLDLLGDLLRGDRMETTAEVTSTVLHRNDHRNRHVALRSRKPCAAERYSIGARFRILVGRTVLERVRWRKGRA